MHIGRIDIFLCDFSITQDYPETKASAHLICQHILSEEDGGGAYQKRGSLHFRKWVCCMVDFGISAVMKFRHLVGFKVFLV